MRTAKTSASLLLVLVLLVGAVGCGDDDDTASGSGSPAEAGDDTEAGDFCGSLQAFNSAVLDTDLEEATAEQAIETHGKLEPLWSAVEESAPDEVREDVDELSTAIDALAEGDTEGFNADETSARYFGMVGEVVDSCVDDVAEITAVDYAFEGVPDTFASGSSGIRFVNESENDEPHEFIIFKKADGDARSAEEILNDPATEEQGPGEFSGAVFAYKSGITAGGFLDLTPGDYIAVCFVPVGGGDDGPPHFTEGMRADFSVE